MTQKEIGRNDQVFFCRMAAFPTRCIVWDRIQRLFPNFDLTIITMNQGFQAYFILSRDIKHSHEKPYHLLMMFIIE